MCLVTRASFAQPDFLARYREDLLPTGGVRGILRVLLVERRNSGFLLLARLLDRARIS